MKKHIIGVLAVLLLAAPALATVTITATQIGTSKVVEIGYTVSGEPNRVRAFALDITVSSGTIVDINNYKVGENVQGYGIFPGMFDKYITVESDGTVSNWNVAGYTPLGDPNDSLTGTLGGLGTSGITIELGSLYTNGPNAPANTGKLCNIKVSDLPCTLTVKANAIRGGVVLENASKVSVSQVDVGLLAPVTECFPSGAGYAAQYADWVTLGKPDCWCASPKGSGYQCDGDADGITSGAPYNYRVYTGDFSKIIANWRKKATDVGWDVCADIDHFSSGAPYYYRVYTADFSKVISNWRKTDAALGAPACPKPTP